MAIIQNKKMDYALGNLLTRQDYLVTQANELAKSFGNLNAFEHKVLDFCFSYVDKEATKDKLYVTSIKVILKHLGLNSSGYNYMRVAKAFRNLNNKTDLYIKTVESDGRKGIIMTHLFSHVKAIEDGQIEFQFSESVAPFVFQLKNKFYSFRLAELARVRSKYTLLLLKLWNANANGWKNYSDPNDLPPNVTINGNIKEWQSWFLGYDDDDKPKSMSAGVFKRDVLNVAIQELGYLYPKNIFTLTTKKNGRKVAGYSLTIHQIHSNLLPDNLVIDGVPQKPRKKTGKQGKKKDPEQEFL